jgi:hypothetical protein
MAGVKKEIKKAYERQLRWFRIGKYNQEVLYNWSFRDWALQIAYRMDLVKAAESWHYHNCGGLEEEVSKGISLYNGFKVIRDTPLVNFDHPNFALLSPFEFPTLFALLNCKSDVNLSIKPATVSEYYLHEYDLDDKSMLYCRQFFSTTEDQKALQSGDISYAAFQLRARRNYQYRWEDLCIFADDTGEYKIPYKKLLNNPMSQYTVDSAKVMMLLDSQAPDKQIHDDLDRVLKRIRRRVRTIKKSKTDLKSWVEIGLLPYMDLQVWSAIRGERKIETCILQKSLFPDDPPSHVIQARTRLLYNGLMSGKQQNWHQLLSHAANPV